MTNHRPPQAPRFDAVSWSAVADSPALQQLLAAASAPGHDDELAGLATALTAFSHATQTSRKKSMTSSLLLKLAAAKALTAAASATVLGGVALAAATGSLPAKLQNTAHNLVGAPAASTSASATTTQDANDTPDANATSDATETASAAPSATPTPSMVGLCHAYAAGVASSSGKALDNPAFAVLINTAGGKYNVSTYCATVPGATTGGRPTALPTQAQTHMPTQASNHPTGAPSNHPTGASASHPTGAPASHSAGRP